MTLRNLPSVHSVIDHVAPHWPTLAHAQVRAAVRDVLETWRDLVRSGAHVPTLEQIATEVIQALERQLRPSLQALINASGVILQTNLGRAPLSKAAQEALTAAALGYTNLEYDLLAGERGSRSTHLAAQLQRVTGAEAGLVVNNAASALVLILSALAHEREVLVSRGHAVEVGGGFRIPDVLAQSGCRLIDVGTTNRTYVRDYAAAISERTGAILRVHTSNFHIMGFVHQPSVAELVALAAETHVPLIDDLGSGALLDTSRWGLQPEPRIQDAVAAGVDLVVCSGDKLLGGPQAGIIVGKAALIKRLAQHPLMRALRVDKLTIAALSATLAAYERGTAEQELPVWQMISTAPEQLQVRAERIVAALPLTAAWRIEPAESTVGGGTLPGSTLPSVALVCSTAHPDALALRLRSQQPPVVGRISAGQVVLDLRSVLPHQDAALIESLRQLTLTS